MNRIKRAIGFLAVALVAVGCHKEDVALNGAAGELTKISITADIDDTRTYINEAASRVEWSTDDKIMVFENSTAKSSESAVLNGGKATFNITFTKNRSAPQFTYNAICPTTSYIGDTQQVDLEDVVVKLSGEQKATSASFDASADLLIAKQQVRATQATELSRQFKRLVSLAKLTFKGLPANTTISEVKFTAPGKALAGKAIVNLSAGEVVQYSKYSKEESIHVKYDSAISATNPIYFTCYPTTVAAGEKFSVTVTTNNGNFTKEVSVAAGKSLRFEEGNLSTFTVDMTGITAGEQKEYKIGDLYNENGVKGIVFYHQDKPIFDSNYENIIGYDKYVYIFSMDEEDLQWSTEYAWCNCSSTIGLYNTNDPFEYFGMDINNYPAFKWCKDHGEGWFLPSSTEMNWMWEMITDGARDFGSPKVAEINKLLTDNGGEPFVETYYWSSNETSEDMIEVIAFMDDSVVCLDPKKDKVYTARAAYRFKVD